MRLSSSSSLHGQLTWLHCSSIFHSFCSSRSSLGNFRNMHNRSSRKHSRLSKAFPLWMSSRASQHSLFLRQSLIYLALQL